MRYTIILMALLPLAGCSSPEERAEREAQKEIAECTQAGYQPNTPAFEDCRLEVKSQEDRRRAARISNLDDVGPSPRPSPAGYTIPLP